MGERKYLRPIRVEDRDELTSGLDNRCSTEGLSQDDVNKRRRIIGLVGAPVFCVLDCTLSGSCVATRGVDAQDNLADGRSIARAGRTWHDYYLYLNAQVPLDRAPIEAEDCVQNYMRAIANGETPKARDFKL